MPRRAKELTALEVKRLKHPGHGRNHTVAVGGVSGLLLQITPNSGTSWVLRVSVGNKRREFGLGSYPEIALGAARDRARELKDKVRDGIDPIAERKAKRSALIAEQRRGLTFEAAIDKFLSAKLDQFSNPNLRILAEHYGVCINTIHSVVLNKTWKCDEYAKRLVDHPIQEKWRFDAVLKCQQKAEIMHANFLAAKDDPTAMKAFFKAHGG